MRVLHLSTYDNFGGAARGAYRQHTALRQAGIDSKMLVRFKHTTDPAVSVFSGSHRLGRRVARVLRREWIRFRETATHRCTSRLTSGLTDPRGDLLRGTSQEILDADVVHVHKTERFVDLPALFERIPASKPVVVALHDLSPITGGCDYTGECRGFQQRCGHCPILGARFAKDYSRSIFEMRQRAYSSRLLQTLAFAANSRWTQQMARQSPLTHGRRVEVIHFGLDTSIYHSRNRDAARAALGIGPAEKVLLFAAHDVANERKGATCLLAALRSVPNLAPLHIYSMGEGILSSHDSHRYTPLGRVNSDELQSMLYRAADLFVIPSLEEAFGQTALEAVACGTVVAGFRVGGIVDIVENGVNGLLVERGNSQELARAIHHLLSDAKLRQCWSETCSAWAQAHFSYARNAAESIRLYQYLLGAG